MRLVFAADVEAHRPGQRSQRIEHPRGERIRIDGKGNRHGLTVSEGLTGRIGGQQCHLPREAQHGLAGGRDADRLAAYQQDTSGR